MMSPVPRIENADDSAQHAFACRWVSGFQQLQDAARDGHCERFRRLANFLLGELERWPRAFSMNRARFDELLGSLELACRARAPRAFIT